MISKQPVTILATTLIDYFSVCVFFGVGSTICLSYLTLNKKKKYVLIAIQLLDLLWAWPIY
jgi:hypothetical protein